MSGLQKSEACYAKPDGSKCYMQPQQMPDGNTYYVAQSEDSGQCYDPGTTLPFVDYPDPDPTDPGDGGGDTDPTDPGDGGDGGDTTDPTTPGDGDTDPTDPSNDPNFQKVLDAIEAFKAGNLSALDDLAKSNAQHLDNVTDAVNGVGQAVGNVGEAVNNLNQTATGNGQKLDALNQTNSDGFQEVGGKLDGIKDGIDGIGDGLNWNPGNASGHTCELLCSAFNQQAVDDIIQRAQEYKAKVASLNTDIHTYMASMFSLDVSGGSYRDYSISTTLGTVDVPFWEYMQQLRYILAIIVMLFATFYVIKVVL
ncbi:hypothetical protein [Gallaecimonas pentaromativorans]|uniref:hypothetical protein n=1 Tax=Gallaecimonas pentaromativorans TaxID=584787 RepID=UPI003A902F0C